METKLSSAESTNFCVQAILNCAGPDPLDRVKLISRIIFDVAKDLLGDSLEDGDWAAYYSELAEMLALQSGARAEWTPSQGRSIHEADYIEFDQTYPIRPA